MYKMLQRVGASAGAGTLDRFFIHSALSCCYAILTGVGPSWLSTAPKGGSRSTPWQGSMSCAGSPVNGGVIHVLS
ncbi:hypothetical protein D9M70_643740 [compost metagenome]